MSTATMSRNSLWEVSSRVIVYSAIGAALYGILLVAQVPIPGTTVSVRPAFALVPFFGYAFGPIVGFFTGLVGNGIGDQLSGWGALTSWNWSIANGLVGLIAGLAPMYLSRWTNGSLRDRAIGGAIAGVIAVIIGFLFTFTDLIIQAGQVTVGGVTSFYITVVVADIIATAILVPILVYAWEPVKDRLGR
ncbi:MAG TPA: ECF transporter S component [Candidatus Limnocylindrales bacterium]|jgi:energy-coupling factor transport system substrate-specific component|nr:ECF transporter S component [Candidatus Limnocylindrales bacterium]